ncbi:YajC family protein [Phycisphaera mikurensis NBRC 102666]|uniref:Sec translocon accessory complex subunit YajC n=1 Tax=Phycisphaera mikurensis (strain NBRC 102666 / KCTC 22515 / FYK2301M01) TaxID=1142394 RepID=I0IGY5_PHYMF|nr:YajC family protein [Phycisphaera mikurensis NBRC 102666]
MQDPFGGSFLLIIGGMFLVMIFFSITSGRKEKKKKAELLASLAKGSKVQTVGGILGTVVEVRDDELVVKVDENSNTRLRFAKSAVTTVLS